MTNDGQHRNIRIAAFVSAGERQEIVAAAKAAGMSLSTFIRVKLLEAARG